MFPVTGARIYPTPYAVKLSEPQLPPGLPPLQLKFIFPVDV